MIKEFKIKGQSFVAVQVPESGREFKIVKDERTGMKLQCVGDYCLHGQQNEYVTDFWYKDIEQKQYEILGLDKDFTAFEQHKIMQAKCMYDSWQQWQDLKLPKNSLILKILT